MAALGRTASFAHKSRKALAGLPHRGQLDMARAIVDSSSVRAMLAEKNGPNPTDRRKLGSKHHLIVVIARAAP